MTGDTVWRVVVGLIPLAFGTIFALNLWGATDEVAAWTASRPKPPPYLWGYITDPDQIPLIGGVFAAFGLLAIWTALGIIPSSMWNR